MSKRGNLLTRRVTVVMSDAYHKLFLFEVLTKVRAEIDEEGLSVYKVDKPRIEKVVRQRIQQKGLGGVILNPERIAIEGDGFDFVGVLIAHDEALYKGRITWAQEIDTVEPVKL